MFIQLHSTAGNDVVNVRMKDGWIAAPSMQHTEESKHATTQRLRRCANIPDTAATGIEQTAVAFTLVNAQAINSGGYSVVVSNVAGVVSAKIMRSLDFNAVQSGLPYPIARVQLVQLGDTAPKGNIPPRLQPPAPDEGPHKSYAIQWFSFATIALVGAGLFAYNDRNRHRPRVDNT